MGPAPYLHCHWSVIFVQSVASARNYAWAAGFRGRFRGGRAERVEAWRWQRRLPLEPLGP